MGENDFTYDCTPRITDKVYKEVSEQITAILRTRFSFVLVPPCAPGKTNHGNIAFQVGGPVDGKLIKPEKLASIIGAMKVKTLFDDKWTIFAMKWPAHLKAYIQPPKGQTQLNDEESDAILVEIHQHEDPLHAEWTGYSYSFGNLRLVTDAILRGHGIHHQVQPDDKYCGLVLRPTYLEDVITRGLYKVEGGVETCDVLLTSDPSAVLRFVGMIEGDEKWYELSFENQEQLADAICRKNRFFDPDNLRSYQIQYDGTIVGWPKASKYFKFFKYFVQSFVPSRQDDLRDRTYKKFTREEAENEARNFFPEADEEVKVKIREARAVFAPKMFWTALETHLIFLILPEVAYESNMKRINSWFSLWGLFLFLMDIFRVWMMNNEVKGECIGAEDQDNLEYLVTKRVKHVIRCVKGRTVNFLDSHESDTPIPYEYRLWEAGRYEVLLAWCIKHRHEIEKGHSAFRSEETSGEEPSNNKPSDEKPSYKEELSV